MSKTGAGLPSRLLAEQDPAGLGGRLQARGGVHHVAEDRVLAVAAHVAHAGDHLTAVDPDPQPKLERVPVAIELAQGGDSLVHGQGGVDRPDRIILVGDRRPEQGHDGVAHELVDGAAVEGDRLGQASEHRCRELTHVLGVEALRQGGEPDDVGEQHADESALLDELAVRVGLVRRGRRIGQGRRRDRGRQRLGGRPVDLANDERRGGRRGRCRWQGARRGGHRDGGPVVWSQRPEPRQLDAARLTEVTAERARRSRSSSRRTAGGCRTRRRTGRWPGSRWRTRSRPPRHRG